MKPGHPQNGLSLIELVVAMAIFALVAVMGVQGLSSMLRVRDALITTEQQSSALGQTVALLRNDLTALIPMLFFPPDRAPPVSALKAQANAHFSLSVAGQPGFSQAGNFHRIEWRLNPETQTLHRRIWSTLVPADTSALQTETTVMEGVTSLRLRSYWAGSGWVDGVSNLAPTPSSITLDGDGSLDAPEVYSDTLPLALEVSLSTTEYGDIRLLESLR